MKILISGYKVPAITENIAYELKSRGFIVSTFLLDDKRHWVDRFFLKRLNSMLKAICRRSKDFTFLVQTHFNQECWYQRRFARQFYEFEPDVVFVIQGKPVFSIKIICRWASFSFHKPIFTAIFPAATIPIATASP